MALLVESARVLHDFSELLNDSLFGIRTAGFKPAVGYLDAEDYAATPYRVIRRLMRHLPPRVYDGSFIDYGCGRGRVALMAARRPFGRVIGVEVSEALHREAAENLKSSRVARCCEIELVLGDAAQFVAPDDTRVAFFYRPFGRATTVQVLRRLQESLGRRRRELWLLSYNAVLLAELAREQLGAEVVSHRRTIYPTIEWAVLRVA
jgi:SAM-dependent methyltransferase